MGQRWRHGRVVEDVAGRDAEVVGVRRAQILEVATDLVEELEPNLRVRRAAADEQLVAAVLEAHPFDPVGAVCERTATQARSTMTS